MTTTPTPQGGSCDDANQQQSDGPSHTTKEEMKIEKPMGRIHFCTINVRLYPTILGENPATFRGPSLEMDWKPIQQFTISVDDHEKTRLEERRDKFVLAPGTRRRFLKSRGYTKEEIDRCEDVVQNLRNLRRSTIDGLENDWMAEYREERKAFIKKYFLCRPEKMLDYPDVRNPGMGNPYYQPSQKVKPMFDKIPCSHCATFAAVGEGSDWPAMVGMFKCDGKYCKEVNPNVCPVTGKEISGVGYRRSSFFTVKSDPKSDVEDQPLTCTVIRTDATSSSLPSSSPTKQHAIAA